MSNEKDVTAQSGGKGKDRKPTAAEDAVKAKKEAQAKKADAEKETKFDFEIAEGHSLCSRKGILGPGEEVKAEYLGEDGEKKLKQFVKSGHIKANK